MFQEHLKYQNYLKILNKFNAFIALGCIIKGETDHYYFISQAVTKE